MASVSRHVLASEEDDDVEEESPPSKRQKVAAACDQCRAKKIKCDGNKPGQWRSLCSDVLHPVTMNCLEVARLVVGRPSADTLVTQPVHLVSFVTDH